ncbi:hypothetical protein KOW79_012949 [Hemibagrus wyckioides]|uniref:TNFR-Cys domain-containing protein n=1 Tax=Hemibagrus wyckioides TaxID=337641 RepID=A0A9D3NJ75_9TELE|nr:tumor necrosis factor receptor superfamily member 5 [Hemibagrus wyckioides]KAG7323247.1 hypothetical protein KOW79_012949 [Hemibagrus wyckioides]
MHLQTVFVLLVLSVITAESCDTETQYMKDNKCCMLCVPGTRMKFPDCNDPVCEECEDGAYQENYNKDSQCKRQQICDRNLNLEKQLQSKKKYTPCKCIDDHHCASVDCVSCVKNTVCKAGEKMTRNGTQMSDRVCEACPIGTFSDHDSALTCQPWTECSSGFTEVAPGSSTSNRICEVNKRLTIITPVVIFIALVMLMAVGLCVVYKKGRTGSISFVQKLQTCCTKHTHTHIAAEDNVYIEKENGQEQQPRNQPQEDTEDLLKLETSLVPGISENGLPVIQDHSKSFLFSETETEPESISVRL